jgi:hypothetical protein
MGAERYQGYQQWARNFAIDALTAGLASALVAPRNQEQARGYGIDPPPVARG